MAHDAYDAIWTEAWEKVKSYENTDERQIDAFFSRLQPQAFSPGFLMITADNPWLKHWVETNYVELIAQALEDIHGVPFAVEVEVDQFAAAAQEQTPSSTPTPTQKPSPQLKPTPQASTLKETPQAPASQSQEINQNTPSEQGFLSTYTFDNFVVGESNRIPYSIALSIAEEPGQPNLNPFFIYGKSGLGKTHLLCAIKNYVNIANPSAKTVYVEAGELVSDYSEASVTSSKNPNAFTDFFAHYESADVLLVDDIQNLQGKEGTLNAVFQILNKMITGGRQVILSADRPPRTINFDERIITRMNQGFPVDIQPPETETKREIIRNFIADYREQYPDQEFEVADDIQDYIAQISGSNIRELKSAVTVVIVNSITRGSLSVNDVSQLLQDHFSSGQTKRITIEDIQKATEQYYGISHEELIGHRRTARIVYARHMAMYLCRTMIDVPFKTIGDAFSGKDHTTVITAYKNIIERAKDDIDIIGDIENLKQQINEL